MCESINSIDAGFKYFIDAGFKDLKNNLDKAQRLIESEEYFREGILVMLCHISAFSRMLYSKLSDRQSYLKIISEYGDKNEVLDTIDLFFFYQWPRSSVSDMGIFKKLNNYDEIKNEFENNFGKECNIKHSDSRYQKKGALQKVLKNKNTQWFDEGNFNKNIDTFSNASILYHILRCGAVHEGDFPLFNRGIEFDVITDDFEEVFEDNHLITRTVLIELANNILSNLKNECMKKGKWPWQLKIKN